MATKLDEIRHLVKSCRALDNNGCKELIEYRDKINADGARHPVLFQIVPNARIMIIGAVPGGIDSTPSKLSYARLVNGQFSLGHKSAQGLGEIIALVGRMKNIVLSQLVTTTPLDLETQNAHLQARKCLGLHITNLVKCNAPTKWESSSHSKWVSTGNECCKRHLEREFEVVNPECVVLLGREVAMWFSMREKWGREKWPMGRWTSEAGEMMCFNRSRFVTAWAHPASNYFHIPSQGKRLWTNYAEQLAQFV